MKLSVVIATHNRANLLVQLLACFSSQTIARDRFEVIVVDDGSRVTARSVLAGVTFPFPLTILEQRNAGAASARHYGILAAKHEVIVVVDDDMLIGPEFLEAHLAEHANGATLVLGHIADRPDREMPLFHRFHARVIERNLRAFRSGAKPRGVHVCTGNVSFRRTAYVAVGGFDLSLARSEDRELGVRLEKAGARLVYADEARTINQSDVSDKKVWFERNYLYGAYDFRISRKHPDVEIADPFHYLALVHVASRPVLAFALIAPKLAKHLSRVTFAAAEAFDWIGAEKIAVAGATLSYGMEYFRGVRDEVGSLGETALQAKRWLKQRRANREWGTT